MKFRVTLELEIADLTDEQRQELEDGINFAPRDQETDDLPAVPTLAEQEPEEVEFALRSAFEALLPDNMEMFAGSEVYARIAEVGQVRVDMVPEHRAYRMLCDAVRERMTIRVNIGDPLPEYFGTDALEAWTVINALEEATVELIDQMGRVDSTMLILPGLDEAEMIANFEGNWIEDWDQENPAGEEVDGEV